MVLFEVQDIGVAVAKLESDAPWSVYMCRVSRWCVTLQRVKVEAGEIHIFGRCNGIKGIQPPQDTLVKPRVDL